MSSLDLTTAGPRAVGFERAARRVVDLTVASVLLLLTLPLLVALAGLIRMESKGSPLFRQRRVGRDGRVFTVNKFRSMYVGCDDRPHREYVGSLIGRDRDAGATNSGLFKLGDDTRVTPVGSFIRRWSLDELPQLWNVVRGEMSLVGPRPVCGYEVESYPAWYHRRFAVKPGMTGLWQVSGRNERSYQEMVRLDCEYVDAQSLWLDVRILVRTVAAVMRRRGAA